MLRKLTHLALTSCVLALAAAVATPSPQEKKEKAPKDQAEYELANKAFTAAQKGEWQTALPALDEWKEKYPESDYKEDWPRMYMRGYQNTNQREKAFEIARQIAKQAPDDFEANFTLTTLTMQMGKTDPAILDTAAAAAKELLKGKPATLNDQQWAQVEKQVKTSAHQTLGWIHMQRKENVAAEREFQNVLKLAPNMAQISYWLGNVVLAQGDPNKNELALFSFARAATVDGEGALSSEGRQQVDEYLKKVFTKYTGTEEGLPALKAMAAKQALPPPDLKIESEAVRKFREEQEARAREPLLFAFIDLRTSLLSEKGDHIWADLKGKLIPAMELYVVGSDSARPQVLNLSSKPDGETEVVLNLENRLRAAPTKNRKVKIDGVASNLSKSPFRLTVTSGHIN